MSPKRVAIVAHRLDELQKTGIERYTEELVRALKAAADPDEFQFELYSFRALSGGTTPLRRARALLLGCSLEQAGIEADLVHVTTPLNVRTTRPLVASLCDLIPLVMPQTFAFHVAPMFAAVLAQLRWRAAHFIAISEQTASDARRLMRLDPSRITVTHCGIGEEFQPVPEEERRAKLQAWPLGAPFILYVGGMHARKNVDRLLRAYVLFRQQSQHAPKLVVAGRENWGGDEVRELIERSGLSHDVVFLGYVDQALLPALLSEAHVFVFPSLYEGFGFPPLEAMACGTIAVSSTGGSLSEVAGPALTFDPRSHEELAAKLEAAFEMPAAERQQRIKQGMTWAARFRWEETAQRTLDVYRQVLSRA